MKIGLLTSKDTDSIAFKCDLNRIYPNAEIITTNAEEWTEDNVNKFLANNDLAMLFIDDKLASTLDYKKIAQHSALVIMNEFFTQLQKGVQINE